MIAEIKNNNKKSKQQQTYTQKHEQGTNKQRQTNTTTEFISHNLSAHWQEKCARLRTFISTPRHCLWHFLMSEFGSGEDSLLNNAQNQNKNQTNTKKKHKRKQCPIMALASKPCQHSKDLLRETGYCCTPQ